MPGLCKVATVDEIEAQGWSLNPGRYVGVAAGDDDGFDFAERFGELSEEFQGLSIEAAELTKRIADNSALLMSEAREPVATGADRRRDGRVLRRSAATPAPADDGPIYLGIKNITEDGHLISPS